MKKSDPKTEAMFRWSAAVALAVLIFSALVLSSTGAAGQNRPRNVQGATPTPTPKPVSTSQGRPGPSPTPTGPLGDAPPPPRLKPTPTPTPPEEIDPESTIKINADLVQLHVRVIDRNNRPIDHVPQNAFHVFEDGVAQPIETLTREEVTISFGLAVDTSG